LNFHKILIKFQKLTNKKLSIADAAVVFAVDTAAAVVVVVFDVVVLHLLLLPLFSLICIRHFRKKVERPSSELMIRDTISC